MNLQETDFLLEGEPQADINMVPLIDVMLVLLVIFLVTAPMLTHAVRVDLPKASSSPSSNKPASISVTIDAASQVHWEGRKLDPAQLAPMLAKAASQTPQPELHLHADRTTPYGRVAEIMSQAAQAGLVRIGFVTDPAPQ